MDPSWNFEWRTVSISMVAIAFIIIASLFSWDRFVLEPRFERLEAIAGAMTSYYLQPIAKRHGIMIPQQKRPQQKK